MVTSEREGGDVRLRKAKELSEKTLLREKEGHESEKEGLGAKHRSEKERAEKAWETLRKSLSSEVEEAEARLLREEAGDAAEEGLALVGGNIAYPAPPEFRF